MFNLLFLCSGSPDRVKLAQAIARNHPAAANLHILAATIEPSEEKDEEVRAYASRVGLVLEHEPVQIFEQIDPKGLNLVITMCENAAKNCSLLLPGHPVQVNWSLPKMDAEALAERLQQLIADLFERGYLRALSWANSKANLILNSMTEGIIAHDMQRRIIYFNSAAEQITGYSREEVVGQDCHNVFHGHLCGQKCSFCSDTPSFDQTRYTIQLVTKSGDERTAEMSVKAIRDENGVMLGVLASFRDLTHEQELARRLGEMTSFSGIIGRDKKMLEVFDLIRSVADVNVPVLIHGPSGTGKELVAAAIHNEGSRAQNLFVPVNCGALPEGLLESELFGHVRGAFTGASRDKKGRFELADGGTIFLDEIGDISAAMQVKLLRVLQEGTFERVGDARTIRTHVRVISATNKDLQQEIAAGRFREDLYYRLCVVPIELPPLRDRCGDIPLLVDYFVKKLAEQEKMPKLALSPGALDALLSYEWPGNIRELQNALQFAMVKSRGEQIEVTHLPPHIIKTVIESPVHDGGRMFELNRAIGLGTKKRKKLTVTIVREALAQTGGNKLKAAEVLGIGRATLYRFIDKTPELSD